LIYVADTTERAVINGPLNGVSNEHAQLGSRTE